MTLGGFVTIVISFFGEIRLKVRLMDVAQSFFASFAIFAMEDFGSVGKAKAFTAKGAKDAKKFRTRHIPRRTRRIRNSCFNERLPEEDKFFRHWLEAKS
jgi:hypothetical protein